MKPKIILFGIIMLILLVPSVYSKVEPQVFEVSNKGLEIKIPTIQDIKQYSDVEFEFHIFNASDGLPINKDLICFFHLYNGSGKHILELQDSTPSHTFDYSFDVGGMNFSKRGDYNYIVQCNTSSLGGFVEVPLNVNLYGLEENQQDGYSGIIIMFVMLSITFFLIYITLKINGELFQLFLTDFIIFFISFDFFILGQVIETINSSIESIINILYMFYNIFLTIGWLGLAISFVVLIIKVFTGFMDKQKKKRGFDEEDSVYGR